MFDLYSRYYDLLYRDKDYRGEADYVISLIRKFHPGAKTVLDLGCGTGTHASLFQAEGYQVSGVDMSATMLEQARKHYPSISFHNGDARNVRLNREFDVITSLFHVASYQTANSDLANYLSTARAHLAPSGIFIFDFWYGPGVMSSPPVVRVKRLRDEGLKILRIAEPTLQSDRNIVNVHYEVFIQQQGSGITQEIVEDHAMRYYFAPELEYALNANDMDLRALRGWMTEELPTTGNWSACVIASAK